MKTLILLASVLAYTPVYSEVILSTPIKVETGIPGWNAQFTKFVSQKKKNKNYSSTGLTECRAVQEIPGAHVCLSYDQKDMNLALGRASSYIEGTGGNTKGVLINQDDKVFHSFLYDIGGHDLKGASLLNFYEVVQKACSESNEDENVCFSKNESELFSNFIIPAIKENPNFVLITYSLISSMDYENILSHEIMHAQYFLDSNFRDVVDHFWDSKVSEMDKIAIRNIFSKNYDPNDEFLMKNEFQAYLLQADAEKAWLKKYLLKYRGALISALLKNSSRPVQVN
jgi:hypothetical protein